MAQALASHSSSFTSSKLNSSTFLITEDDSFGENPFIYAKLHPSAPVLILTDTGCDSPSKSSSKKRFTHLRDFLEHCPVACNQDTPINPGPRRRRYIIICSHCHYDHTLGIPQFSHNQDHDPVIIASAAGRDFIESDLATNGLFQYLSLPTPEYTVTHWAQAFEKLHYPVHQSTTLPKSTHRSINHKKHASTDLSITLIQTPGHTPDSLSWYDHSEKHLFIGDTLYEQGASGTAPIEWTLGGNLIEWYYSVSKLLRFVQSENVRAETEIVTPTKQREASGRQDETDSDLENDIDIDSDNDGDGGWAMVPRRVKLAAGHITDSGDAEELLIQALRFLDMVLRDRAIVVWTGIRRGEKYCAWRCEGYSMYFSAPLRLVVEAKAFFGKGGLGRGLGV